MRALTADVVVVGSGPAGMAATAAARADGATVLAVEAGEAIGGNAVRSNGYLAFVGSQMQTAHAVADDEETFVSDARRAFDLMRDRFGLMWDEQAVRLFARESAETYRDLTSRGVRFSRVVPRPEHSVDRVLAVQDPAMFGRAFAAEFAAPGVDVLHGTAVDRLITDGARVTGVQAHELATGEPIALSADRGVVIATGGYQANPALRQRYQPASRAHTPYLGMDTCRGAGHLIGQAIGADLVNMTFVPPMVVVTTSVVEEAIAINAAGRRFHDETGPYHERVARLREQSGQRAWYVFDDRVAREKAELIRQTPEPAVQAESVADLAATLDVPRDALEGAVARWNDFLASPSPSDPDFGRRTLPSGRRPCAQRPFTAVPMVEGINFSCGGFRTTSRMQVVDVFGKPIPGLFAAGDCVSGLNAASELGGLRICGGFTLGRVAGHALVRGADDRTDHGTPLHVGMTSGRAEQGGSGTVSSSERTSPLPSEVY